MACPAIHFPLRSGPENSSRVMTIFSVPIDREGEMIRKLKDGQYRIYSRTKDAKTGKRRNLGTFTTRQAAEKHEREIQYFKRH